MVTEAIPTIKTLGLFVILSIFYPFFHKLQAVTIISLSKHFLKNDSMFALDTFKLSAISNHFFLIFLLLKGK